MLNVKFGSFLNTSEVDISEEFLSDGNWSIVALRDCKPFTCNFPLELCRRPVSRYQDETSNTCARIPQNCLLAANDGKPLDLRINKPLSTTNYFTKNEITLTAESEYSTTTSVPSSTISSVSSASTLSTSYISTEDICNMDQPQGRFCGFRIKVAYNRNNERCEQFWFPGCRTADTNSNLFDTVKECEERTRVCKGDGSLEPFFPIRQSKTSVAVEKMSSIVPVVAPFLATTKIPRHTVLPVSQLPERPLVAPTARPIRLKPWTDENIREIIGPKNRVIIPRPHLLTSPMPPVQPNRFINPSSTKFILDLISNGISQLTGGGWNGDKSDRTDENSKVSNLFSQIPQIIRSLQGR
ncbi:unnamed protein product [Thelazia callipaeda]|uniref:BPTI/Kunitz inhibitor domain-containing protein n=1 Tax=Thelazia callipaeda TaxID=103827 RepID=A0A0N5CYT8_THECL|nr:unnamed protein product [Thelazia callipaeda]